MLKHAYIKWIFIALLTFLWYAYFSHKLPLFLIFIAIIVWLGITAWGSFDIRLNYFIKAHSSNKKINRNVVALTFDDGPNASMLPIVDSFKKYNGACTFFLIGQNINAGQTAYLNHALDNGCQLASHTFKHDGSLINSTSKEEVLAEFENTNIALNNVVGVKTTMARLPGLGGNELIYETCKEAGIPLIAGFGVTDWSGTTTTAQDVANTVIKNATDGSIFVMHSTPKTAEALEIILPELEKQGYDFVTVEELFEGKGYSSIPLGYQLNSAQQQY